SDWPRSRARSARDSCTSSGTSRISIVFTHAFYARMARPADRSVSRLPVHSLVHTAASRARDVIPHATFIEATLTRSLSNILELLAVNFGLFLALHRQAVPESRVL